MHGQISRNNILVYKVGDGTSYGTNTAAPAFVLEYLRDSSSQSSPVRTIAIPNTGSSRLVNSFSATTEGLMSLSNDSTLLVFGGYDTTIGTTNLTGTSTSLVPRVIDTISWRGLVGRASATTSFSAGTFRSATAGNGADFWGVGSNSGVVYLGNNTTPAIISTTTTNIRALAATNNKLYYSTASGTVGIYKFSGIPTTTASPSLFLGTGAGTSPSAFAVNAAETVVYSADDRNTAGGIFRWTLSGSTWTATDTLKPNYKGVRGLTVDWSGAYPIVFATTTDNKLIQWIDSNNSSHIFTILATAGTNEAFRGVTLAPKSPCNLNAAISYMGIGRTCVGDSIQLTANSAFGLKYQWYRNGVRLTSDTFRNYKAGVTGTYTVAITDTNRCTAISPYQRLYINPKPDTSLTFSTSKPLCTGDSLIVCVPNKPFQTYQWSRNGSIITGTSSCDTIGIGGSYRVYITDTFNHCTDSSRAFTVTSYTTPSAALVPAGKLPLCQATTMTLHTNKAANLSYVWSRNDTVLSGNQDSTLIAAVAGIYKVRVQLNGTFCADSASDTLIVVPPPNVSITKLSKDTVCEGDTIRVRAGGGPSYQFEWVIDNFGTSGWSLDSNYYLVAPTVTGLTTASYKLFVMSGFGCIDSSSVQFQTISPLPLPIISFVAGTLTAGAFSSYQWYLNGNQIVGANSATYKPTALGNYTVLVTNAEGCSAISDPYVVSDLAVGTSLANVGVLVYPNPTSDIVNIKSQQPVSVVLGDMTGRVLLTMKDAKMLHIRSLAVGIYQLKIYREDGLFLGTVLLRKASQ